MTFCGNSIFYNNSTAYNYLASKVNNFGITKFLEENK